MILLPTLLLKPILVKGMPYLRAILPFKPERPTALFHENENPNFFPTLLNIYILHLKFCEI